GIFNIGPSQSNVTTSSYRAFIVASTNLRIQTWSGAGVADSWKIDNFLSTYGGRWALLTFVRSAESSAPILYIDGELAPVVEQQVGSGPGTAVDLSAIYLTIGVLSGSSTDCWSGGI